MVSTTVKCQAEKPERHFRKENEKKKTCGSRTTQLATREVLLPHPNSQIEPILKTQVYDH